MFEKYYNGVIEQVYERIGKEEKNIVMACYNNDFSVQELESVRRYSEGKDNVYFALKEYKPGTIVGAFDPFLDVIFDMYRKYINEDFDDFLTQCEVYELQRETLQMYYESGICKRTEGVLLNEVSYEQKRMAKTIALMLKTVAEYQPIMLVINRFQMASRSTIALVNLLLEKPSDKIGIVLGANIGRMQQEGSFAGWERLVEKLKDSNQMYHIGSYEKKDGDSHHANPADPANYAQMFIQLNNIIEMLDFEQARVYFDYIERQIKFEDLKVLDSVKLSLYYMYVKVAILQADISKALDLIEDITQLKVDEQRQMIQYQCAYYRSMCYMYQGKLDMAQTYAEIAQELAKEIGDAELEFKAQVIETQVSMSGWYNIFFCVRDVAIEPDLISKLMKYNYRNNLAHFYIYAYDNRPEVIAKAYRSEAALKYFSKGITLAKELGNEKLVNDAYQKNIMLASTNGMNEIALLYAVRNYQFTSEDDLQSIGRLLSGIGYNLSALGKAKEALEFYNRANHVFMEQRLPEDIAETCYNYALTQIAEGEYKDAEVYMQYAMMIVEKLHLNSIRVCNLSKLYAIQALLSILQGNRFDCERYLMSCSQFLNYVLVKEEDEIVHDYARSEEDNCLYLFARALLKVSSKDIEGAFEDMMASERYFTKAEGNLFFMNRLFRKSRMDVFEQTGRKEMYEAEKESLLQFEELMEQLETSVPEGLLDEISYNNYSKEPLDKEELEEVIKQEALIRDGKRSKRQLQFILTWQSLLDTTDATVAKMVKNNMRVFLNHCGNDCAFYVRFYDGQPKLLYNDTNLCATDEELKILEENMIQYPQGFAVSKISHTFSEHREVIDIFGADDVCSFAAVPFFNNGKLRSYLITYIKMKDNWHSSINRYMIDDDDLQMYRLLFMEFGHAIKRVESYAQIFDMNQRLKEAATTDTLTGVYNRAGMYARLKSMQEDYRVAENKKGVGVMFIDLDNFKPYNDAYGHDVGDLVLKEMSSIFREAIGDNGFLSRYGGDEFIIVAYTDVREELEEIANNIYRSIESANGFTDKIEKLIGNQITIDKKHKINCSIGICTAGEYEGEVAIENMIKRADDSLYKVKEAGKGHYAFV